MLLTDLAVVLAGDWPGQTAVSQVPVDGRRPENTTQFSNK